MTELGPKVDGSELWKDAEQEKDSAWSMAFMKDRRSKLLHGGYTTLGEFPDPIFSPEPVWKAAGTREGFPGMEMSVQSEFVSSTFPGEVDLKEEGNQTLWNAIFNSAVPHTDEKDRNKGVARHIWTKELLVEHVEDGENMQFSKPRAALDVWLG